jgi:hypothetical protein
MAVEEAGPIADQLQHAYEVRIVGGQTFGVPCDQTLQKARDDRMLQLAGRHLGKMPLCGEMDGVNELDHVIATGISHRVGSWRGFHRGHSSRELYPQDR